MLNAVKAPLIFRYLSNFISFGVNDNTFSTPKDHTKPIVIEIPHRHKRIRDLGGVLDVFKLQFRTSGTVR